KNLPLDNNKDVLRPMFLGFDFFLQRRTTTVTTTTKAEFAWKLKKIYILY
ncbi:MAG: hypothetical protein ACI8RD_005040, partial [Bacillariaceae sp.]